MLKILNEGNQLTVKEKSLGAGLLGMPRGSYKVRCPKGDFPNNENTGLHPDGIMGNSHRKDRISFPNFKASNQQIDLFK